MDDMTPNASPVEMEDTFMQKPKERVEQEQKEQKQVATTPIGLLENVLAWFDQSIEHYSKIDSLNIDPNKPETAVQAITLASAMRAEYTAKKLNLINEFKELIQTDEK